MTQVILKTLTFFLHFVAPAEQLPNLYYAFILNAFLVPSAIESKIKLKYCGIQILSLTF